jgi:hypothetical protein
MASPKQIQQRVQSLATKISETRTYLDEQMDEAGSGELHDTLDEIDRNLSTAQRQIEEEAGRLEGMGGSSSSDDDGEKGSDENTGSDAGKLNPAEDAGEAVGELEQATQEVAETAAEQGRPDLAVQAASAGVEGVGQSAAAIEQAAETVETIAEEVAAEAAPGPEGEAAEEAVEAAGEAVDAAQELTAEVREEQRELGGETVAEAGAAQAAIEADTQDAAAAAPPEAVPAIEQTGEIEQQIATEAIVEPEAATAPARPSPIPPQDEHPWYKRRSISVFGKKVNL